MNKREKTMLAVLFVSFFLSQFLYAIIYEEKMKSEWRVASTFNVDEYLYFAKRVIDPSKPEHSGNVEAKGYSTDRQAVEELVAKLNAQEEEK